MSSHLRFIECTDTIVTTIMIESMSVWAAEPSLNTFGKYHNTSIHRHRQNDTIRLYFCLLLHVRDLHFLQFLWWCLYLFKFLFECCLSPKNSQNFDLLRTKFDLKKYTKSELIKWLYQRWWVWKLVFFRMFRTGNYFRNRTEFKAIEMSRQF